MSDNLDPLRKIPEGLANIWTMYYRQAMNANLSKNFYCDGGLQKARMRAEKHCKILNLKFIFVRPLISNLDFEEAQHLGEGTDRILIGEAS
jgi:hypothetical protein